MPHAAPLTHPPTYTLLDPQERLDRLRRGGSSDGGSHRESHGNDSGTGSGIDGDTFLHKAMRDEDVPALRRLLASGAEPDQQVGQNRPKVRGLRLAASTSVTCCSEQEKAVVWSPAEHSACV